MALRKKLRCLFALPLIIALLVPGVSSAAESTRPLKKMRVSYSMYIDDLPFYVAMEEGFWKKQGLDVELVRIESAKDSIPAAIRGDIQTGSIGSTDLYLLARKGLPIKAYAWFGHSHKGTRCGIHVDKNGPIYKIEDMAGKKITTSGSVTPELMLKEALAQHNMKTDDLKALKGIQIDAAMQQEAALRSAGVDGTVTCDPVATMLEMHGASRRLASFNDIIPGFVFTGIFFTTNYVKENPEEVRAFLRGVVEAFKYIKNNEEKARSWLPKYSGVDKNIAMNAAMREFSLDGKESEERLLKIRDLMIKYGYLDEKISLDRIVDYSYLPK